MTDLREAARALLALFDGGSQHIVDAVVLRKSSPEIVSLRAALAAEGERVSVPREIGGLTPKQAWWAGARAGLGVASDMPRTEVARLLAAAEKEPHDGS